jgi:putative transposase
MPDHMHWLLQLGEGLNLSAAVQRFKSLCTKQLRQNGFDDGPVWARGFHDRALRREEDLLAVARYVLANPLRAGLVSSVRDYPLWDAIWL